MHSKRIKTVHDEQLLFHPTYPPTPPAYVILLSSQTQDSYPNQSVPSSLAHNFSIILSGCLSRLVPSTLLKYVLAASTLHGLNNWITHFINQIPLTVTEETPGRWDLTSVTIRLTISWLDLSANPTLCREIKHKINSLSPPDPGGPHYYISA